MAEEQDGKKRHRSPAYPAVGLPEAIVMLKKFYASQRRALVHLNAAYEPLGYEAGSSNGGRVIAALISYGLMIDEGTGTSRKVKISDLGYKLVILGDEDPDWLRLVREAAVKPKLFSDLITHWSEGLPSDSAIRQHLLLDLNFNENAVKPLIKDFRETYEFAQLGKSSKLSKEEEDKPEDEGPPDDHVDDEKPDPNRGRKDTPPPKREAGMNSLVIPIRESVEAEFRFPATLTLEEFEDMKDYLDTFLRVQERKVKAANRSKNDEAE